MGKIYDLTEGEILLLLVRRSGRDGKEIAEMLNIHPNHLSKLYKSESLTQKIKRSAARIFKVDESVFFNINGIGLPSADIVKEPDNEYGKVEEMTALDAFRYLEEKDKRHFEERARLLGIIENLTKSK